MFLYAISLLVPPSACQMSTACPFRTRAPNRSPSPYTARRRPAQLLDHEAPFVAIVHEAGSAALRVSTRPPALKDISHGRSLRTLTVRAPLVRLASSPSTVVCTAGASSPTSTKPARPVRTRPGAPYGP